MLHNLSVDGSIYRLRPICDGDASLVVELRCNPELNRFLHASSSKIDDQLKWLESYYKREDDFYFVIENCCSGVPEGVIALYDVSFDQRTGEWGRWILRPGSLAAVESAYLIYKVAFDLVKLESVFCRTVADNAKVVSFHDSCGLPVRKVRKGHFHLASGCHDAVEHWIDRSSWSKLKPRLESLIQLTAKRMNRA